MTKVIGIQRNKTKRTIDWNTLVDIRTALDYHRKANNVKALEKERRIYSNILKEYIGSNS